MPEPVCSATAHARCLLVDLVSADRAGRNRVADRVTDRMAARRGIRILVPAATVVERLKLASPATARPEPPSPAVQPIETSSACQFPSAEPPSSTRILLVDLVPTQRTRSRRVTNRITQPLRTSLSVIGSHPLATLVDNEKLASDAGAKPEPPSAAVQARLTSLADQALAAAAHENVGAFLSTLKGPIGPA